MDTQEAIRLLEASLDKISDLQTQPALGPQFEKWYLEVLALLDSIFGQKSKERSEFGQIDFRRSADFVAAWDQPLQDLGTRLGSPIAIPDDYYFKRLYDAKELLLAFITILKKQAAS